MSLVQKKAQPKRAKRSPVTPFEIKGRIILEDGQVSDIVLIWNVSSEGLCLWAATRFKNGDRLELEITHPEHAVVAGEVRWCRAIPDRSGYLIGLLVNEQTEALQRIAAKVQDAKAG